MKKGIMINDIGSESWIGGVYYTKNIAFVLSQNELIVKKFNIILLNSIADNNILADLPDSIKVINCGSMSNFLKKLFKLYILLRYNIVYRYPFSNTNLFFCTTINWIPDFQHHYFPYFFSDEEIIKRNTEFSRISQASNPLVLSSESALNDFKKIYSTQKKNIYVVPFVSFIVPEINNITIEIEDRVLTQFSINNKPYACIMNQFWQHKNHKIVLEAIEYFNQFNENKEFYFVFTGKLSDYRNSEYINNIKDLFKRKTIKNRCILLGFIDRIEQIVIMKNAEFVIQPSLFEGWGTVVEDAKVLDKTILLSDIPVHREQMNEKSILFNPYNAEELADLISKEVKKDHHDDIDKGIKDMYKRARKYSSGFQKLLGC